MIKFNKIIVINKINKMKLRSFESLSMDKTCKLKKSNKRVIGIEILRMFLCFRIILLHYYSSNNEYILKLKNNQFQVPCFFFISFYFLYPIIFQRNTEKLKLRLERLLIPYIIYPIIVWIINNIMFLILKYNRFNRILTFEELKLNLILGKGIFGIGVLWFHFNLIIFTIIFFISSFFLEDFFLISFQIIAFISYSIQYSQINYEFFKHFKIYISQPIGNLVETLPLAIFAFSLYDYNTFKKLSFNRKKSIFFSLIFLYYIFNYNIFLPVTGYQSAGIKHNIVSFLLFSIFFLIPFEELNQKVLSFFQQITKYTQGIYCLHFLIQYYQKLFIDKSGTFIGCIILYIISYFFSFIGFSLFQNTKLKFLFS